MSSAADRTSASLTTPLRYVKGVGEMRAAVLERLGLKTPRDVLFFFPRAYEEVSPITSIADFRPRAKVTVRGVIDELELREFGQSRSVFGMLIRQNDDWFRAVWFNQPFLVKHFQRGQSVLVTGEVRERNGRWQMNHPDVKPYGAEDPLPRGALLPVYSLTQGIQQARLRRLVHQIVEQHVGELDEVFPAEYLAAHGLLSIVDAVQQIHMPQDESQLAAARRRFVYQELLVMQLALALRRQSIVLDVPAPQLPLTPIIRARIERVLALDLTPDQRQAIDEIAGDLARPVPMNRLLQGDVGTGKTLVAMFAMLQTVAHGRLAVLMAPTELLARQHAGTLEQHLENSRVRIGLLTGQLTRGQRQKLLTALAAGEIDILVGTTAVANAVGQDHDAFARLGLLVIDEQHKFGVAQRAQVKLAGLAPHYLVMTATPIPRTLTMTAFGDLDVSTLRTGPPGRQIVHTYMSEESQREKWWEFFRKKLREGRQGYVVSPLVDESAATAATSAEQAFEHLACDVLEEFRLGLVHGGMSSEAKEAALSKFAEGETQVLVATTVVEVGIDVPNATLMTIESAERFGLAQLHQLRGRVSRGTYPGYVCVFANVESEESRQRLQMFCDTTDGFALAEADFALRGPGDLFGTRQHGLPPLRVADLQRDTALLEEARRDAQALIAADPKLADPAWERLRRMVLVRYGSALTLGDVG